ncbi:MAG: hypothetical protein IT285_11645 [Bdellovibrionales bacterium]|nr:hypothetical protein [Bdellovibrionales bacterium]
MSWKVSFISSVALLFASAEPALAQFVAVEAGPFRDLTVNRVARGEDGSLFLYEGYAFRGRLSCSADGAEGQVHYFVPEGESPAFRIGIMEGMNCGQIEGALTRFLAVEPGGQVVFTLDYLRGNVFLVDFENANLKVSQADSSERAEPVPGAQARQESRAQGAE